MIMLGTVAFTLCLERFVCCMKFTLSLDCEGEN